MIRFVARLLWTVGGVTPFLLAQTKVDLRNQSKTVDFQTADSTKPFKTGPVLPVTCSQGEMFFLTTAAAGMNSYGCGSPNTWTVQTGAGPGATTIQNTGTVVGTRPILNLSVATGVVQAISDTGQSIQIQSGLDTALVSTKMSLQSGSALLCSAASASPTAYTCSLSPVLTAYTAGMVLRWRPDLDGTGGVTTLNIDTLGVVSVKLADGRTDPAPGDIVGGRLHDIWYNGTVFVLLKAITPAGILGEMRPACSVAIPGRLWYIAGSTGVKDSLSVCAKDATDSFSWRALY